VRRISLLAALALTAAPAAAGAQGVTVTSGDALEIAAGERRTTAALEGQRLRGPDVALSRTPEALRGEYLGQDVLLATSTGEVYGKIGATALTLVLSREGRAIVLEGELGRESVDLLVSPSQIRGLLGPCTYSLRAAAQSYEGWRDCNGGGRPEPVTLTLPRALTADADPAIAALLSVVLAPLAPRAALQPEVPAAALVLERFGLAIAPARGAADAGHTGVRVTRVVAGSPAAAARLDEGMQIVRAGLEHVHEPGELHRALLRLQPGESLVLWVHRPGTLEWTALNLVAPQLRPAT